MYNFFNYPHTDLNQSNLDWIIGKIKELESKQTPIPVSYKSNMKDPNTIYLYVGTESDMQYGYWYYFNPQTETWTAGGAYGVDTTTVDMLKEQQGFSLTENVVCVGDSFLQGYTTNAMVTSWGALLEAWAQTINPDAVYHFAAEGGAGYTANGQLGHNFPGLLNNLGATMTAAEKSAVQTVIVIGGVNDVLNNLTVDPANTLLIAKTLFPNAKIVYGMSPTFARVPSDKYYMMLQPIEGTECLTDLQFIFVSGDSGYNSGDNLHPNQAGQNAIAKYIIGVMQGNPPKWWSQNVTVFSNANDIAILRRYYGSQNRLWITGIIPAGATTENNVYVLARGSEIPLDMKYAGQLEVMLDGKCRLIYSPGNGTDDILGVEIFDTTNATRINAYTSIPFD